ncbi:MAG: aspartate-semialdehyde dehydrogenase [Candidatus Syntrophosphaera sp.]|nr:aspartate-semialdehyde dehydrogenase [Candidatus Syntrophosphaera sp.]
MKIAIVGATGEVGRMMITCLEEGNIHAEELDLYASARSEGTVLYFGDRPLGVQVLTENAMLRHYDYVLFSAGAGVARSFAPIATEACNVVIDNSSAFRQDPNVPLIVPEINGSLVEGYCGIIANPNCTTIQLVLPLAILDRLYGLSKVVVSTYQAVSGSGHKGISTLQEQRSGGTDKGIYPELIDLNVIPQIGAFQDDGYSQEEEKIRLETRKILDKPDLAVAATAVRVPVIHGHSESVYAEFERPVDLREAAEALAAGESIAYDENTYITPRDLGSSDSSHVCRLRLGTGPNSVCFWNVGHNVRLGAATNAVRILARHAKKAGLI